MDVYLIYQFDLNLLTLKKLPKKNESYSFWSLFNEINNDMEPKKLNTYICGITPYAPSHFGHLRSYMTFDIIRRIMTDYLKWDLVVAMNITDIDDKIINKAHEEQTTMAAITTQLTTDFFEQMDACGILRPHILCPVTNYIEEIKEFIQKIIDNGFAYLSNGSIYFDTQEFIKRHPTKYDPFHIHAPDDNTAPDDWDNAYAHEKKDNRDFVLWKAKKHEYEPSWPASFTGHQEGRFSWHPECAAIITTIFNKNLHLHAGGIDLKTIHHTASSLLATAYFDDPNYTFCENWIHFGHLNIKGKKMSKSLKNFTPISELLQKFSPQIIRIFFLQHDWDKTINYDDDSSFLHAITFDKTFNDFMGYLSFTIRKPNKHKWHPNDTEFLTRLTEYKHQIDTHIRNNYNTRQIMSELQQLFTDTYVYASQAPQIGILQEVQTFITHIVTCFGLHVGPSNIPTPNNTKLIDTFVHSRDLIRHAAYTIPNKEKDLNALSKEDLIKLLVHTRRNLLQTTDTIRDAIKENGIKIEDNMKGHPSVWKNC